MFVIKFCVFCFARIAREVNFEGFIVDLLVKKCDFFQFLKLKSAITSSKMDLGSWFRYQNVANQALNTIESTVIRYFPYRRFKN